MDQTRWNKLKDIFSEAIDAPAEERATLVSRLAEGDQSLAAEAMEMLLADDEPNSVFTGPADRRLEQALELAPQAEVGPYRVIRRLGAGGMGVVYLAERHDGHFQQRVALKLIKRGMDSEEILRRFRAERQILAHLEHPNIARLIDGGVTSDGSPYFAMEFVDGLPITTYCDERALGIPERLELFKTVCDAVQTAHQNLVVHRDIKPGNILVDQNGMVKLVDFGIAKALDEDAQGESAGSDTDVTRTGIRVMTPGYASPEQVSNKPITTASDVYSLGVTLYELLTGQKPHSFAGMTPLEIERTLESTEPSRPSAVLREPVGNRNIRETHGDDLQRLRRQLFGDLDNICLMSLRYEPSRRYSSAGQLREDIDRYLNRLPITARADTLGYRMRRFYDRHKPMTITVAASVILAIGLVSYYTIQLTEERDRARLSAQRAEQTADFMTGLFSAADPNLAQGKEITARELLEQGRERVDIELADQPQLRSSMLKVIGFSYGQLGLMESARELLTVALDVHRDEFGNGTEEEVSILTELGFVFYELQELDSALACYEEALALSEQHFGYQSIEVQSGLNNIGATYREMGLDDTAAVLLRQALDLGRTLPDIDSLDLAHSMNQLGRLLSLNDRLDEAEPYLVEGLEIRRKFLGENDFEVAASRGSVAGLYRLQGRLDESAKLYLENVWSLRKLVGESHHYAGATLSSLAHVEREKGNFKSADTLYQKACAILEATLPSDHSGLSSPLVGLGLLRNEQGRYSEAEAALRRAYDLRADHLGTGHRLTATAGVALGASYLGLKRNDEARMEVERARETLLVSLKQDHRILKRANLILREIYEAQSDTLALNSLDN